MKYILLFIFFTHILFALSINESLLKIHAVLVPKISLMDYDFKRKLKDNAIVLAILYDKNDYKNAKFLQATIENRYHKKLENYTLKTLVIPYKKVAKTDASLYYLFPTDKKTIKKVVKKAKEEEALTFSYATTDLNEGVMLSLKVGTKVKPIINLHAVKINHIIFRPVLLKISHIYKVGYDNLPKSSRQSEHKTYFTSLFF